MILSFIALNLEDFSFNIWTSQDKSLDKDCISAYYTVFRPLTSSGAPSSVHNRARNSKKTLRLINQEFEKAEILFNFEEGFKQRNPCQEVREDVAAEAEAETNDWIRSASPEEFDAMMETMDVMGVGIIFKWEPRSTHAQQSLHQRIRFS